MRRVHLAVLALTFAAVAFIVARGWLTRVDEPPHPPYAQWIGTLVFGGLWAFFALISTAFWLKFKPGWMGLVAIYAASLFVAFWLNFGFTDLFYEHWVLDALGPDPCPPGRHPR